MLSDLPAASATPPPTIRPPSTSTKRAPWYVVPGDDKKNARLFVSRILLDAFDGLDLAAPKADAGRRRELEEIREKLGA